MGGFWATGGPWSAKSDQFWVDIFKPKWNLSYIDGARLRDSEPGACLLRAIYPPPLFLGAAACHGGVGGSIGPIASKEGRFYNRPGVVTQKAKRAPPQNSGPARERPESLSFGQALLCLLGR